MKDRFYVIDPNLSKENALPFDLGVAIQGLRNRLLEKVSTSFSRDWRSVATITAQTIYSCCDTDLYSPMYGDKVVAFLEELMASAKFDDKPFMRHYLDYFDIYWICILV